jgi:hypothetical protein
MLVYSYYVQIYIYIYIYILQLEIKRSTLIWHDLKTNDCAGVIVLDNLIHGCQNTITNYTLLMGRCQFFHSVFNLFIRLIRFNPAPGCLKFSIFCFSQFMGKFC